MSLDWGVKGLGEITSTSHAQPSPATDPSSVTLPRGFTVCIVGASRGIGAGICRAYARAGATALVLASRRIKGLEQTAKECQALNRSLSTEIVNCDITSADSVAALANRCRERFGHLDVVVVNSGYSGPVVLKVTETDPETFQNAINVNYVGTFLCAKYLIPLLSGENKAFIAVSSFAALIVRGPIANAQYCVSKMAQLKLMEHIHEQYAEEGLAAFSVHPGGVMTEMASESAPEAFRAYLMDSPDVCGAFCVWLTKAGRERHWLSGRLLSAKWDVGELEARKEEIVEKDLLKTRALV